MFRSVYAHFTASLLTNLGTVCVCVCILKYFNFNFVIHFIIQKTHWLLYWAQLAGVVGRCGSAGQPV